MNTISKLFSCLLKLFALIFSFIIWLVLIPLDILFTTISPNNKLHKFSNKFYYEKVRPGITKGWASRISFTFAHGITHILIFVIAAIISWKLLNINSSEVKNKFVRVSAISHTGHKADTFALSWSTDWELDKGKLDGNFTFTYRLSKFFKDDTAHYELGIVSNFDLNPDTSITYYKNGEYTLKEKTNRNISLDVKNYITDSADSLQPQRISFKSNSKLFDDEQTPYVNFYLDIRADSVITDSTESHLIFYLNNEFKCGFGNMPYEIIDVKPEPETNCPYKISYESPEKIKEVLKKGIYISTVNKELKAKKDKEAFLYSVLIGAFVSLLFTIMIELFSKWRNLNRTLGKEDPYNEIVS